MSRIGKQPIVLPSGVEVKIAGQDVTVKGPKGILQRNIHPFIEVTSADNQITVAPKDSIGLQEAKENIGAFWGLSRSLLNNMVLGVSRGFEKSLDLVGVGYRAQVKADKIHMNLGFSHDVVHALPEGVACKVEKNTHLVLSGVDKQVVGQVAADIRSYRKPEPYHGKGVRYSDERVSLKAGKSAKK